jgi:hypothetical protein
MNKTIIIAILMAISGISYADQFNCDSNCLNGTDMTMTSNSTTGTQTTTSNAFSYFTGTTCNGYNLVNNFSNGSQTIKEANSSTCGYVAPAPTPVADSSTGNTTITIACTDANPCPGAYSGQWYGSGYTYVQGSSIQSVVLDSTVSSYTGQPYTPTTNSAIVMDNQANGFNTNGANNTPITSVTN